MSDNLDTLMDLMGKKLKNNIKEEHILSKKELVFIQNKSFKY